MIKNNYDLEKMKFLSLSGVASLHRFASGLGLTNKDFIKSQYKVTYGFFAAVSSGKKKASTKLLMAVNQSHLRLFPSEPVLLALPKQPPVLLGHISTN